MGHGIYFQWHNLAQQLVEPTGNVNFSKLIKRPLRPYLRAVDELKKAGDGLLSNFNLSLKYVGTN